MASSFRDLRAYRLARALSGDMRRVVAPWPSFEKWSLGRQLLRAVDSIGANIAEGSGRWHAPDQRRFFHMARGSLCEAEHWMLLAVDQDLLAGEALDRLSELAKPLNGLINARARR